MNTTDKIKKLLSDRGLPPHKHASTLSSITGKTPQAIHKWFRGDTAKPDYENVRAIADFYKVDPLSLWDDEAKDYSQERADKLKKINLLIDECLELGIEGVLEETAETLLKLARKK